MRTQYEDTYIAKYDHPFTAFLAALPEAGGDECWGDMETYGAMFFRYGRHIISEDSRGFVQYEHRLSTADLRGQDEPLTAYLKGEGIYWHDWDLACEDCAVLIANGEPAPDDSEADHEDRCAAISAYEVDAQGDAHESGLFGTAIVGSGIGARVEFSSRRCIICDALPGSRHYVRVI